MSTRACICIVSPVDGCVHGIYCHNDGYPSGVGKTLVKNYTDPTKVYDLLALGDLSILGAEIGEKHSFDRTRFDDYYTDQCTAYHRDGGDKWSDLFFASVAEAIADDRFSYCYFFYETPGEWLYSKHGDEGGPHKLVVK